MKDFCASLPFRDETRGPDRHLDGINKGPGAETTTSKVSRRNKAVGKGKGMPLVAVPPQPSDPTPSTRTLVNSHAHMEYSCRDS
jgi:hypothetical protein